ncbi:MFS transporter, partial [bacterium]|nr:MFS transporter [bacterium]
MLDFVPAFLLDFAIYVAFFTLQHVLDVRLKDAGLAREVSLALFSATYTTVYVIGCMTLAPVTDAHGRRRSSIALGAAIAGAVPLVALRLTGIVAAFYALMVVLGVGSSLFWPAFQARVAERAGEKLGPALARFNVGWTAGKALGLLLGGKIYALDPSGRAGLL